MISTIQIVLIVILAAGGIAMGLLGESLGLHPSSTGAFTGALIAAAAAMLGAWLTWLRQQDDKASADAERRDKIKLLVGADLAFVLSTLTSNIAITQIRLQDFITGQRRFDSVTAPSLCQEVARDLIILALAFEAIAPSREFTVENQPLESASAQLRRLAAELTAPPNPPQGIRAT